MQILFHSLMTILGMKLVEHVYSEWVGPTLVLSPAVVAVCFSFSSNCIIYQSRGVHSLLLIALMLKDVAHYVFINNLLCSKIHLLWPLKLIFKSVLFLYLVVLHHSHTGICGDTPAQRPCKMAVPMSNWAVSNVPIMLKLCQHNSSCFNYAQTYPNIMYTALFML